MKLSRQWKIGLAVGLVVAAVLVVPTYRQIRRSQVVAEYNRRAIAPVNENEVALTIFYPPMTPREYEVAALNQGRLEMQFMETFLERPASRAMSFESAGLPDDRQGVAAFRFVVGFDPKLRAEVYAWMIARRDEYHRQHTTRGAGVARVVTKSGPADET